MGRASSQRSKLDSLFSFVDVGRARACQATLQMLCKNGRSAIRQSVASMDYPSRRTDPVGGREGPSTDHARRITTSGQAIDHWWRRRKWRRAASEQFRGGRFFNVLGTLGTARR